MLRPIFFVTVAFGLVVSGAPGARADMCFHYRLSGGGTLVANGAKLPLPNTCASLALYEREGQPLNPATHGLEGSATGSICQDWAGATVVFHYTYDGCMGPDSYFESGTCRLQLKDGNLPTTGSTCRGTYIAGTSVGRFRNSNDAVLEPCDASDVNWRVPNDSAGLCLSRSGFFHRDYDQKDFDQR
jgi:hypothetical protein